MAQLPGVLLLIATMFAGYCRAFPSGAPRTTCQSMRPAHGVDPQDVTVNPSPYYIAIDGNVTTYDSSGKLSVEVRSLKPTLKVRGFILEARMVSGHPAGPVGTFSDAYRISRAICDKTALTHGTFRARPSFNTTWTPPSENVGDIYFVATILQSYRTFWMNIRSHVLARLVPTTAPPSAPPNPASLNVTDACAESVLTPLPVERPHVAILCDAHAQCPCGWQCCPSCVDDGCAGHAICRQPLEE